MKKQVQSAPDWPPKVPVCVGAVVIQGERALFVRQSRGQSLAGQWSIPWGLVEPDEPPEAAALRETREEAGVEAEVDGLLGIQNLPRQGWMGIVFLCRHVSGVPAPDGGVETDRAVYLSLTEMSNIKEPFEKWCEWLVRRVLRGKYQIIPAEPDNPYRPRLAFL
jgi:ADP-ribose pyrophosphatase YjhB (NUDIX family)